MENKIISVDEAVSLLKDGKYIHTFRNPDVGLVVGLDESRASIIKQIKKHAGTLQTGGPESRAIKHGLVLKDEEGYLFIETDMDKLNKFDPLPELENPAVFNKRSKY